MPTNSEGKGSNSVANFFCEREKQERDANLETKKRKKARPRMNSDARARSKSDSILSSKREKETRFEGCKCGANDHLTRET